MPSGTKGLLPWKWAEERLQASHNYYVMTVRPDATPHAMPVWGVWVDDRFYFSTGAQSRKARNLAANASCLHRKCRRSGGRRGHGVGDG